MKRSLILLFILFVISYNARADFKFYPPGLFHGMVYCEIKVATRNLYIFSYLPVDSIAMADKKIDVKKHVYVEVPPDVRIQFSDGPVVVVKGKLVTVDGKKVSNDTKSILVEKKGFRDKVFITSFE